MNNGHFPHFFTATINDWKHVLKQDITKRIVLDSLKFLVKNGRIKLYAYVIMPNHIHLIWKIADHLKQYEVQRNFLKFTAQQIKFHLIENDPRTLELLRVNKADRLYQIWQKKAMSIELWSESVFEQKLDYIHWNPCQHHWQLCVAPEEYEFSSARFYLS